MIPHNSIRGTLKIAFLAFLLVCSGLALITAFEIEYLNWKSGDAIERKARQEPHSKWRVGEGFILAAQEAEAEIRAKHALGSSTRLTGAQHEEVHELARIRARPTIHDRLGTLLRGRALLQYPLGIVLVFGGFVGFLYASTKVQERLHFLPLAAGLIALFLAGYRDYFGTAGW